MIDTSFPTSYAFFTHLLKIFTTTYGGPNKFFGDIVRILMEYAFVHTNPTNMPQKKETIIITGYQGGTVDWGILTEEGLRAALVSFQYGK